MSFSRRISNISNEKVKFWKVTKSLCYVAAEERLSLPLSRLIVTYAIFDSVKKTNYGILHRQSFGICVIQALYLLLGKLGSFRKSFQFLLNAWLQQPHLKDFDSPQKVTYLKRLIRIIADWFDIFQTSSSSQSSHVYALKDFMKCCGNNLPPSKNKGVTRIMLCNIDSEIWDRLTTDMEVLCRRAVNCLKHIACKYQIDLNPEKEFLPSHTVSVNRGMFKFSLNTYH
ncbi:unnamed protein product [Trichobilharzia regenti]|nr:unnamed protein product [Trichobilharzia regenti]